MSFVCYYSCQRTLNVKPWFETKKQPKNQRKPPKGMKINGKWTRELSESANSLNNSKLEKSHQFHAIETWKSGEVWYILYGIQWTEAKLIVTWSAPLSPRTMVCQEPQLWGIIMGKQHYKRLINFLVTSCYWMQWRIFTQHGKDCRIWHIAEIELTSRFTFFSGAADVCDVSHRTRVTWGFLPCKITVLLGQSSPPF